MLTATLLSLLLGCSHASPDLVGDECFTPEERARVEEGVRFLAYSTGTPVPGITWAAPTEGEMPRAIVRVARPAGHLGDSVVGGPIEVDPGQVKGEVLAVVVAHEMGHRLGLGHLAGGEEGLMQPYVSSTLKWTESDRASCVAVGVCR